MSRSQLFTVSVTHEDRMWVGICDDLGLVTEARSFDRLTQRVSEIAPELGLLNCDLRPHEMHIEFIQENPPHLPNMA